MYAYQGSIVENQVGEYSEISEIMMMHDFEVGGGWEVDHGYFDKKLGDGSREDAGYLYLRIPAFVERGNFGDTDARVRLGTPFLLHHRYQDGTDTKASPGLVSGTFNQFSAPEDPDAPLSDEAIEEGRRALQEVERSFGEGPQPEN